MHILHRKDESIKIHLYEQKNVLFDLLPFYWFRKKITIFVNKLELLVILIGFFSA
jgi:hypothetical protein